MIALVTASHLPDLCEDDQPLLAALNESGIDFAIEIWNDETVDWSGYREVILRSPWDYPLRAAEFSAWCERTSRQTRVHNDPALLDRNRHKGYLAELAKVGVPVVPTVVIADQSEAPEVARQHGWEMAVLKPAIGLGGRSMAVFTPDSPPSEEPPQADATQWCVQPYLPSIRTEGEYSVVVIDGVIQHVVLKRPGPVDFRVHDGRGGTHDSCPVTSELAAAVPPVLNAFGAERALYARVDLIRDPTGRLVLLELDVTSPCLYTEHNPGLAAVFAAAVARRVRGQRGA